MSLIPHLWNQIIQVNNLEMQVNYGMDKMRFGQPVITGSRVRLVTSASLPCKASPRSCTTSRSDMVIHIINGPNLNLVGVREPEVYGNRSLDQYLQELAEQFPQHSIDTYQSNIEGEIVDRLQAVGFDDCGIILNAGGYTHTSVAIADAVAAITAPVVEVHISNIYSREPFRHKSLLSPVCKGIIAGFGLDSYRLALLSLVKQQ